MSKISDLLVYFDDTKLQLGEALDSLEDAIKAIMPLLDNRKKEELKYLLCFCQDAYKKITDFDIYSTDYDDTDTL